MARPEKRNVEAGEKTTVSSKRVTPKGTRPSEIPGGIAHEIPESELQGPSPMWVPVLMFGLLGLGAALIFFNYAGVLPGAEDGNGWYLVGGLGAILAGIMVATQLR